MDTPNFFFIDSTNTKSINPFFVGYALSTNPAHTDLDALMSDETLYEQSIDGCFVSCQCIDDRLVVSQDAFGSFGLYFYQADDYFALSNSFFTLIENLADKTNLTLNRDFTDHLLFAGYSTFSCTETPVNEISCLPRNSSVLIDIIANKVNLHSKPGVAESITLGTRKSIEIIDAWHARWTGLFEKTMTMQNQSQAIFKADITAGMDSRLCLMLLLSSSIDLSSTWFATWEDDTHTHIEDLEISALLAQRYGFQTNTLPQGLYRKQLDLRTALNNSFYPKLGFHRQMFFNSTRTDIPLMHLRGAGGEIIRKYDYETLDELQEDAERKEINIGAGTISSDGNRRVLERNKEFLEKLVDEDLDNPRYGHFIFKEAVNKSHFGKWMVEDYLINSITLAPTEDHELQKIANPPGCENLLYVVLLMRFRPDLLDFPFDGNRSFDEETLRRARIINDTFKDDLSESNSNDTLHTDFNLILKPANAADYPCNSLADRIGSDIETSDYSNPYDWCKAAFESPSIKDRFLACYTDPFYSFAKEKAARHVWQPLDQIYATLAVAETTKTIN